MKKILLIAGLFVLSCGLQNKNNGDSQKINDNNINMQFVEGSRDIPLASGLEKINDEAISFDSIGGNVISVSYKNNITNKEIKDFYLKTLPQMGWKFVPVKKSSIAQKLDFKRNKEKLEIEFVKENDAELVKFYAELGV